MKLFGTHSVRSPCRSSSLLHMALHVFAGSPLSSSVVRMEFGREVFHDGLALGRFAFGSRRKVCCATPAFHMVAELEKL